MDGQVSRVRRTIENQSEDVAERPNSRGAESITPMRQPIDIDYVSKAIIGMASPLLGLVTSYQEQIEWHLRVASLLVGLLVGIMSLVSMVKKMRRK